MAATMPDWMVSEPAWVTGPGGLSGSVRPPTSCAPGCSDALVQMRTAAQLPWHVVAAPNEASRWSGGFRTDCTGCLKHAHTLLARFATHQAKLDRYSALIAKGKKPMGRPPVPMQDSTASGAQCRGRRTSRYCGREPVANPSKTAAETGGKYHRSAITDHADPQGIPVGYNAQIAVTGDQLIVAVPVGQSTNDKVCFLPMTRYRTLPRGYMPPPAAVIT
jgi:hypothetical protein